jgi:citronellol/citronellal dehydrogenase
MGYASIFAPDLFRDQVHVVTGGGSGIGRCIAHELASLGAHVVVAGRKPAALDDVVAEVNADGGTASAHAMDVRREQDVRGLIAHVISTQGRLDGLVNNAGGQFPAPLDAIPTKGWQAVIDTNLTSIFLMCREAVDGWMREHGGVIVNMVADMWRGMPMMGHSGAARAGVVNLTQTAALEWAPYHVRVNAVAPGLIASSGFKSYPEAVQQMLLTLPAELPARRFGTESEVSAAVCFLLSPAASYISGATLRVDSASSLYRHPVTLTNDRPTPAFDGFHRQPDLPPGLVGDDGDS